MELQGARGSACSSRIAIPLVKPEFVGSSGTTANNPNHGLERDSLSSWILAHNVASERQGHTHR